MPKKSRISTLRTTVKKGRPQIQKIQVKITPNGLMSVKTHKRRSGR